MQIRLFEENEQNKLEPTVFIPGLTIDERLQKYHTHLEGQQGYCDCEGHRKRPYEDCTHIKELRLRNLKKTYESVLDHIIDKRDERDKDNTGLEGAIDKESINRAEEFHDLMNIVVDIAKSNGTVCSDDLHNHTNEAYRDDKIVGTVFAVMLRLNLLEEVGRKATVRKCAHGRRINVYKLKEE